MRPFPSQPPSLFSFRRGGRHRVRDWGSTDERRGRAAESESSRPRSGHPKSCAAVPRPCLQCLRSIDSSTAFSQEVQRRPGLTFTLLSPLLLFARPNLPISLEAVCARFPDSRLFLLLLPLAFACVSPSPFSFPSHDSVPCGYPISWSRLIGVGCRETSLNATTRSLRAWLGLS